MSEDFNTIFNRKHADSLKWNRYPEETLPMFVADMDFPAPDCVQQAMQKRLDHGIFGYSDPPESLISALIDFYRQEQGWLVEKEWILWFPGLVPALSLCCQMTEPGEEIATFAPIYPPFLSAPSNANRGLLDLPLVCRDGEMVMDCEDAANKISEKTRMLLLCNPQNPSGRVYRLEELAEVADLMRRFPDLILVVDEIHSGLVLAEQSTHINFAKAFPDLAMRTITLHSVSKTYNLAGLMCAWVIVPDQSLRKRLTHVSRGIITEMNCFGYAATESALRNGESWRQQLLQVLRNNCRRVEEVIGGIKNLHYIPGEATYLAWIDARELGLDDPAGYFTKEGLALSDGRAFAGPGYIRLNFACPPALLEDGLARLQKAVKKLLDAFIRNSAVEGK